MTESTSLPRSYRWLVLAFVSLAMFGNYYAFDALNPVGPLLESQLGFTQAQIGLLDSSYNVAALLVLLAGGVFIDRAGREARHRAVRRDHGRGRGGDRVGAEPSARWRPAGSSWASAPSRSSWQPPPSSGAGSRARSWASRWA